MFKESLMKECNPEGVVGVARLLSWEGKSSKRLELKFVIPQLQQYQLESVLLRAS